MTINKNANNTNPQPSSVQRIIWWFAGADIPMLEKCRSEWHKFTAIGTFVAIIGVMASISGGFFLTVALGVPTLVAVLGGICWGIAIVSVDRVLLTHFHKGKGQLLRAIPRLVMAVVISIVISHPLLLVMFQGEIDARLHQEKTGKLQTARTSSDKQAMKLLLADDISKLEGRLAKLQSIKDDAEAEMNKERGGLKTDRTTGRVGEGSVYDVKRKIFEAAQNNLESERPTIDAELSAKRAELSTIENEIKSEVDAVNDKETKAAGILNRQRTLSAILKEDPSSAFLAFCITFLLLSMETLPITQKLFSRPGRYDFLMNQDLDFAKREAELIYASQMNDLEHLRDTETAVMDRVIAAIESGDFKMNNSSEADLAKAIHFQIIREKGRRFSKANPSESGNGSSFDGTPIYVEVADLPGLSAQLTVPIELEATATLEDLSPQIKSLSAEVAKDLGHMVKLSQATNSEGEDVDQNFLALIGQLKNDRRLLLRFERAISHSDTKV